mgnify:CR=1 FL=1
MEPGSYNILLAEDDRFIRFILSSFLKKYSCIVDEAGNGYEALKLFEIKHYDMILMDVNMPVMNGIDATMAIRNQEASKSERTFIVGISSDEQNKIRCLANGMDEFYPKPLMVEDIIKLLGKNS